jgi:superfamily I DNA/RNA helicase
MSSLPLDPDQRDAVAHRDGPCLVLAGPGSGKTRVIVERFLALATEGVPPSAQLVLTYTRKAAAEMRSRAEAAHGPFAGEPPLSNYHALSGSGAGWPESRLHSASPMRPSAGCTSKPSWAC